VPKIKPSTWIVIPASNTLNVEANIQVLLWCFDLGMQDFARQAEAIFRGSDRRSDLDKAYSLLLSKMFFEISRIAAESQKTPQEVVLFGEPFQYLTRTDQNNKFVRFSKFCFRFVYLLRFA